MSPRVFSQEAKVSPTPPLNSDETILVNTNLIQTSVSVFDKKGKFVGDLKKEDFELKVGGKIVPINFFESFADSAATKSVDNSIKPNSEPTFVGNRPRRSILFVVDDVHLAFDNFKRTKDLISRFIETEKKPDDSVAIVSTSGKIGDLQLFTNNVIVLRAALARLNVSRDYAGGDKGQPPMTEFEAQEIDRQNPKVTDAFLEIAMENYPPNMRDEKTRERVREEIRSRARTVLFRSQTISRFTYDALEQALRQSGKVDGRKLVFFLSDGFLLDLKNTNSVERINRIADTATRANAVIYTIDMKGLDASLPEGTAKSFELNAAGLFESGDALAAFADRTGGKFFHNTNAPGKDLTKALAESSYFYLIGWQTEDETLKPSAFRQIEITVRGKPELQVKSQSGYLNAAAKSIDAVKKNGEKTEILPQKPSNTSKNAPVLSDGERRIQEALTTATPIRDLNFDVLLNYQEKPGAGAILNGIFQIGGSQIQVIPEGVEGVGKIQLAGIVYDADGKKVDEFNKLLTVNYTAEAMARKITPDVYYEFQSKLKPGLYQIRTAAREVKSNLVGSNSQSLEIPDLATGKLQISSLQVKERREIKPLNVVEKEEDEDENDEEIPKNYQIIINAARRFERDSFLQCKFYIYNYQQKSAGDDLTIQLQIFSDNKLVAEIPFNQSALVREEPSQIFYAAEISLETLSPGRYQLQAKAKSAAMKNEAVQKMDFEIK